MKREVQEMMIVYNVEDKIVDEWVNITKLIDRKDVQKIYARRKKQKPERKKMRCKERGSNEAWKKSSRSKK